MQNIIIFKNREIYRRNSDILGIWGENNYETLCFGFYDDFIDGDAILEFEFPNGQKKFVELEKNIEEKFYKILIKSSLLQQEGDIKLELKIINENEIIYKTKIFIMKVLEAINATATFEDDYPDFVTTTTAKLEELEKNKQDKLVPGENITIKDGVISATGGISTEETDPTVPDWAKKPNKPTYTAEEVGALPNNTVLFSGNYDDLNDKPEIPSIEGLASETYVDEKVSSINIPDEVVIGTEEPTTDDWKIFIDESEPAPEYITNAVDDLVNYYLKTETYNKEEVNSIIDNISTINILVVDSLPTENISTTTIYFLPKITSEESNIYDEYIYVSNSWEKIGDTKVDLSEYIKNTDYATSDTAGIIRVGTNGYYGLTLVDGKMIRIQEALESEITARTQCYRPITPHNLEFAVQSVTDTEVTENSASPVSSVAVKTYVDGKIPEWELIADVISEEDGDITINFENGYKEIDAQIFIPSNEVSGGELLYYFNGHSATNKTRTSIATGKDYYGIITGKVTWNTIEGTSQITNKTNVYDNTLLRSRTDTTEVNSITSIRLHLWAGSLPAGTKVTVHGKGKVV